MHPSVPTLTITNPGVPAEQIFTQLRTLIATGQLPPGAQLPSVRSLARTLHLAPNTVVHAYHNLEHEGWVTLSDRKAAVVRSDPPTLPQEELMRPLRTTIQQLLIQAAHLGLSAAHLHGEIDRHLLIHAEQVPPALTPSAAHDHFSL